MASRQEEKERRRRERMEAEQAAASAAARRRRIGIAAGVLAGLAVVAVAVVFAVGAVGGDDGGEADIATPADVRVPDFGVENLDAAVKAAGCRLRTLPSQGRDHVDEGTEVQYDSNPPTSGPHFPVAAEDGIYEPGNSPQAPAAVHSLEHGRINFQYKPGTPQRRIQQLEALVNEEVNGVAGYHTLLFENQTDMDAAVAATAWTQLLTCSEFNDRVFDALRAFRERYVDKGPEFVP